MILRSRRHLEEPFLSGKLTESQAEDKIPSRTSRNPHLWRRLWFTLLARIVGAQIAVCGAMPAFVLKATYLQGGG